MLSFFSMQNCAKYNNFFGFGVLLLLLIIILLSTIKSAKNINEIKDNDNYNVLLQKMSESVYISTSSDGPLAYDNPLFLHISSTDSFDKPVLVVYYSQFSCEKCIRYLIDKINHFFPDFCESENVLFVSSNYRGKPPVNYGHTLCLDRGETLNLPMEDSNTPFVFIYCQGVIFDTFVPDEQLDDLFSLYLENVRQRFF